MGNHQKKSLTKRKHSVKRKRSLLSILLSHHHTRQKLFILVGVVAIVILLVIISLAATIGRRSHQHEVPSTNYNNYCYDFTNMPNHAKRNSTIQVIPPILFQGDENNPRGAILKNSSANDSRIIDNRLYIGAGSTAAGGFYTTQKAGNALLQQIHDQSIPKTGFHQQQKNVIPIDHYFSTNANDAFSGSPINCSFIFKKYLLIGTYQHGLWVIPLNDLVNGANVGNHYFHQINSDKGNHDSIDSIVASGDYIYYTANGHLDWFCVDSQQPTTSWWNTISVNTIVLGARKTNAPFYLQPTNPVLAINNKYLWVGADEITAERNGTSKIGPPKKMNVLLAVTSIQVGNPLNMAALSASSLSNSSLDCWNRYYTGANYKNNGQLPCTAWIKSHYGPLPGYGSIGSMFFYKNDLYILNTDMGFSYVHNPISKNNKNLLFTTFLPQVLIQKGGKQQSVNPIWSWCCITNNNETRILFGMSHGAVISFTPICNLQQHPITTDIFHRYQIFQNSNLDSQQIDSLTRICATTVGTSSVINNSLQPMDYILATVNGDGALLINTHVLW